MRLITFRHAGREHIGVQLHSGILDLNRVDPALPKNMRTFLSLGERGLAKARLAAESPHEEWLLPERHVTLLAPLPHPSKIICIGHNYVGHTGIGKTELPEYPNLFCKTANTIIGHDQPVRIPPVSSQVDFEAELMVVLGRRAWRLSEAEARACIAGYTIFNDVSARDYQKRTSQWMLGKSFDTFGPMGQALVTPDEIPDPGSLEIRLSLNDVPQQRVNTRDMVFSIPFLISYISQVITLEVGDVLATGTPAKLPEVSGSKRFLQPGDVIEITIDSLGSLRNPVQ